MALCWSAVVQSLSGVQFATSSFSPAHRVHSMRELRMDLRKPLRFEVPPDVLFQSLSSFAFTTATSAAVLGLRDRLALFFRPVRRVVVAKKPLKESAS